MKFDLERAKKEGFLYKNSGALVPYTILEVVNQGDIHETIIFKFFLGATWYGGAIKTSIMDDVFRNLARELWVVILRGDTGVYVQGNHSSRSGILEFLGSKNFDNIIKIKCIYREGEES